MYDVFKMLYVPIYSMQKSKFMKIKKILREHNKQKDNTI